MQLDTKFWDKEVLLPSLLFILWIYVIILYPLDYDINIIKNGVFLIILFFSYLFLFFFTNEHDINRKFRIYLLKDTYSLEYQKTRILKKKISQEKPYTYIYDKKLNQHLIDEVNRLDLNIVLFTNFALVLIFLIIINSISLIIYPIVLEINLLKLIFNISSLIIMPLLFIFSLNIIKRYLMMSNDIYIRYLEGNTDDFI